jgi:aminoglycoside phosphotransferase (APT) family kinase protein
MANIDQDLIYKAIREYTHEQVKNFNRFETGAARTVYDVETKSGKHYILYLCTKEHVEQRFEKEELLLEKVNNETDIPTPRILYSDFSKKEIPFMYYIGEKIEGYNPVDRFKYLPKEDRMRILKQSARYLGRLHKNVQFDDFGDIIYDENSIRINSKTCKQYIKDWSESWIEDLEDTCFSDLQSKARKFIDKYDELAETADPCCVHFDVRPENLIVEKGGIKSIIDWEKSISHAPEWDLQYTMILFIHGKFKTKEIREEMKNQFFKAYLKENKLDEKWKQRLLYFNTIWSLKGMNQIEEIQEDDKEKLKNTFRSNLNRRYEDLNKEACKTLPNNF